jgi:hypothetical protein
MAGKQFVKHPYLYYLSQDALDISAAASSHVIRRPTECNALNALLHDTRGTGHSSNTIARFSRVKRFIKHGLTCPKILRETILQVPGCSIP